MKEEKKEKNGLSLKEKRQARKQKRADKKAKEKQEAERQRLEARAPLTERTRSYYRFAKNYPNEVTPDGYRKNEKPKPHAKTLKIILAVFLCVIAFSTGLFLTKTAIEIAKTEPTTETVVPETQGTIKAKLFDENDWTYSKTDTINELKESGINTLLIEIKKPSGILPYSLDSSYIKNIVQDLKDNGFEAAAYISCLKDTTHASSNSGQAVLSTDDGNPILYDKSGYAYLNPFSEDAISYLTDIVKSVSAIGFRYIFIDDVTLPVNTGSSVPYYEGYTGKAGELNKALTNVVNKLTAAAGSGKVILVTDVYGFCETDGVTGTRYEGTLSPAITRMRAIDVRTDNQNETGKDPLNLMPYLNTVPDAFVLDATSLARQNTNEEIMLFAICSSVADAELAVTGGIENTIVFN